ncbi:MAG: hypothetical protein WC635_09475 [Bacteriovorax sp.]|jgi:hypothetical protein
MRYKIILLACFFFSKTLCSQEQNLKILPYKKNIKEKILDGQIFSESYVQSFNLNKEQSLRFSIAGLHPKSCSYALKTLSLYENYSRFLSFVKESQYNESKKEINFVISHFLLPYDMRLIFSLPRINKPGVYPFTFDIGLLKNLHGNITVTDNGSRCLFYSNAEWRGPHTGINNTIFELFSQVLSKLSMEILFRKSSTLAH